MDNFIRSIKSQSTLKQYEGKTIKLEKSADPPILMAPSPVSILLDKPATLTRISADDYICRGRSMQISFPIGAVPGDNGWEVKLNSKTPVTTKKIKTGGTMDMLEVAEYFREKVEGVFAIKDSFETFCITNIRIRIQAIINRYYDEELPPTKEFKCQLYCDQWDTPKFILVPKIEYKQIYSLIRKKFPETYLSSKGKDALDKYLSEVYNQCKTTWAIETHIMYTGWTEISGELRFAIGEDEAYKNYDFPDVSLVLDRAGACERGLNFLQIGKFKAAAIIPFIFSHFAYTAFFVNKANHSFDSVLFIRGESGARKTSVAKVICNVFETTREKNKLCFGTTKAAFYTTLSMFRDQNILLDDYSCSEQQKKQADNSLFEAAIRAIGDAASPSKMSNGKGGGVDARKFRSTLVVTGEDDPPLSASSQYRMINVSVADGSYDNTILRTFQEQPAIMATYYALFIEFLRIHGDQIVGFINSRLADYREQYTPLIKKDRVRDAAINLMMMAEIIRRYVFWCGVTDPVIIKHLTDFENIVLQEMLKNQEEKSIMEPEVRFIYALMQLLGTRDKLELAETETIYVNHESEYIGFHEKSTETIWLRYEDVESFVRIYWEKQGTTHMISSLKLRQLLYERAISIGTESASGKMELLKKAKKGQRKRMLVLKCKKIQEILEGINQ